MKTMFAAAIAALMLPGAAGAQAYAEPGDAGRTLAAAADTTTPATGAPLSRITGILTANDADLYRIYIAAPGSFSATTVNAGTQDSLIDTALFLFDAGGHAIATNDDDAGGLTTDSTLPAGDTLYRSLAAGYYFLGISASGNEPTNGPPPNQLLFATGSTTAVRGSAGGLNPTTLGGFDDNAAYTDTGAYRIDLTGVTAGPASIAAAVPEPAAWTLSIMGLGLAGGALRRRPRRSTPLAAA